VKIKVIIEEFRKELGNIYGNKLKDIILYGSWARGSATDDSDIDLLVVFKGSITAGEEIDRMINVITDLNLRYNILISVYPVSEKNYSIVDSPLLMNVRKEGIPA